MRMTKELIDRFLRNECSPEEVSFVSEYFIRNPHELERWMPYEEWVSLTGETPYDYNEKELYKLIKKAVEEDNKWNPRSAWYRNVGIQIAALFILAMGVIVALNSRDTPSLKLVEDHEQLTGINNSTKANLYYINSSDKVMHIEAGGQSVIALYPNSEIRFAEVFDSLSSRDFYLVGKAQFDVATDSTKAFNVHSKGMKTTALGTVFVVEESHKSRTTKVKLLEGAIQVTSGQKNKYSTVLTDSEEIEFDNKTSKILGKVKAGTSSSDRGGFYKEVEQEIIIQNMNVVELLLILENNFGIQTDFEVDLIEQKYYSGTFQKQEDVYQNIIEEINYLHTTDIKWKNRRQ